MVAYKIECDGEIFNVSHGVSTEYHYTWMSGRNDNYGFSVSTHGSEPLGARDHVENIRNFLAQIDPETGYIED